MAYDEALAFRIRKFIGDDPDLVEKKMFGGVGFMLSGNMACGVHKEWLVLRLGPEKDQDALKLPTAKPFDITGRTMRGWVMVLPDALSDQALGTWLGRAMDFARSLPAK